MTDRPVAGTEGLTVGADGLVRCSWATSTTDYVAYHDTEWARPVHGDVALFERLTLEGFQSGLSWLTILRKREAFRRAFAGFDPVTVASFGDTDVVRLLADAGIVRNRTKIGAAIANARALIALQEREGPEALDRLVWSHAPDVRTAPRVAADVPTRTLESIALARSLKRAGFVFVGPTTAYALMQACGLVDDHLARCAFRRPLTPR